MSIYSSKKVILPSKIDELGLYLSLTRLPQEDIESLKKRKALWDGVYNEISLKKVVNVSCLFN
jgi:hypothetical protein